MPKLDRKTAKAVAAQQTTSFEPVPPGKYVLRLRQVTTEVGAKGPYWKWEFEIPKDAEEYSGRRFWMNTSLSEAAQWKLKETFDAFGYSTDSDTDEMCGEMVLATIGTRTIQAGQRAGEEGNEINKLEAYAAEEEEDEDEEEEAPPPPPVKAKPAAKAKPAPAPVEEDEDDEEDEDEEVAPVPVARRARK